MKHGVRNKIKCIVIIVGKFCFLKELDFSGNLSQNWNKYKKELKLYLKATESLRVIEKIDKPTDWVNSIVIVEKSNGEVRIC